MFPSAPVISGLLGSKPSWDMMQDCDTLLVVGCSFPTASSIRRRPGAKAVQIDIDGRLLSLRLSDGCEPEGRFKNKPCRRLMPLHSNPRPISPGRTRSSRMGQRLVEGRRSSRSMMSGNNGAAQPRACLLGAEPKLPDRCIIAADSGTTANWYARDLKIRRGMMASGSGNLATMGAAVPTPWARNSASPTASASPSPATARCR